MLVFTVAARKAGEREEIQGKKLSKNFHFWGKCSVSERLFKL